MFSVNYFLLLNPDIVLRNNILSPFTKMIDNDKEIGIIGPKLLNEEMDQFNSPVENFTT